MPKRTDIKSILIIGAGPIVIGQACEFDYSGTQACKALKAEGYKIILVNSNPATIMTDPEVADVTYIEPITTDILKAIIITERPDALLATLGGQTALNAAIALDKLGILNEFNVEMIGVSIKAIELAEDRTLFQKTVHSIGLTVPKSASACNRHEAELALASIGLPLIIRSSFSLGGSGAAIIHTKTEFKAYCDRAFSISSEQHLMFDEALIGWKEYELEVVRDSADNCIVVCGVENVDPLGIHTGDSITVAPIQTLTDKEYQTMRQAAFRILRIIGVDTGGSNVQFAVNPKNGDLRVIEMNPRVSRSSALVSKASGFPIAKIAAKLAVGYTLNECKNDITGDQLPASFEPSLDYVVVKIPRFNMEKFASADQNRGPQMYSVGEVMAIGQTFPEALQKAINSLEIGASGLHEKFSDADDETINNLLKKTGVWQLWAVAEAMRRNMAVEIIHQLTHIDPWFLCGIEKIVAAEHEIKTFTTLTIMPEQLKAFKQLGFTDERLAFLMHCDPDDIKTLREAAGIKPVYKRIDSCAGEFPTPTAYLYDTFGNSCEAQPTKKAKMLIIGSGPNRIGQGIEFDYCCVQAVQSLKKSGFETIMVNCNPETVSTDYDIVDRLYFVPLTLESVLSVIDVEKPDGVFVQYGGQTPLHLAQGLAKANVPLMGLTENIIAKTEDRAQFQQFLQDLQIKQPLNISITKMNEAMAAVKQLGFPVIIRPSYVIGGTSMIIANTMDELKVGLEKLFLMDQEHPVLIEQFLVDAVEFDIDAVCDGETVFIPGLLEHVESAGIHSGDSAGITPPIHLSTVLQESMIGITKKIALKLEVKGVINIQYAVKNNDTYVIEVNPRASRTLPFMCKATGISLVDLATQCTLGNTLSKQGYATAIPTLNYYCVKEAVLPFAKFPFAPVQLGPEMKSTGEVMGIGKTAPVAYAKAQLAAGNNLPQPGDAWVIADDRLMHHVPEIIETLEKLGFKVWTAPEHYIEDLKDCVLVIALADILSKNSIVLASTRYAVHHGICYTSTWEATQMLLAAIDYDFNNNFEVVSMQTLHQQLLKKPKHFLTGEELNADQILHVLKKATELKATRGIDPEKPLKGMHLALLFDKPSLRTRCSFTVAMRELGGDVVESLNETRKAETPEDHIHVLAGYCHAVMIRTFDDTYVQRMAIAQKIPVINGLTDLHHPCQIFADLMTLQEIFNTLEGLTLCYIGDGNNMLNSLLLLAPIVGVRVHYCCPASRGPNAEILARAHANFPNMIVQYDKPSDAVKGAHAVYTDVWASMGFEEQRADHLFEGFQVNEALMAHAEPNAVFLHCLPMERGKEVSATLPDQPCSVIYQQSENRLHVQKAILLYLLSGEF